MDLRGEESSSPLGRYQPEGRATRDVAIKNRRPRDKSGEKMAGNKSSETTANGRDLSEGKARESTPFVAKMRADNESFTFPRLIPIPASPTDRRAPDGYLFPKESPSLGSG